LKRKKIVEEKERSKYLREEKKPFKTSAGWKSSSFVENT